MKIFCAPVDTFRKVNNNTEKGEHLYSSLGKRIYGRTLTTQFDNKNTNNPTKIGKGIP
jgi:hypothetical protein